MDEQTPRHVLAHRQQQLAQRLSLEANTKLEELAAAAEKEIKAKLAPSGEVTAEARATLAKIWDDLQGRHDAEIARLGKCSDGWGHWSRAAESLSLLDQPQQPAECAPRDWWEE